MGNEEKFNEYSNLGDDGLENSELDLYGDANIFSGDFDPDDLEVILIKQDKEGFTEDEIEAELNDLSEDELWELYPDSNREQQAEIRRVIAQKKGLKNSKKAPGKNNEK
jgi:hypothetical protein